MDRANRFARCVLAMHAGHRHEVSCLHVIRIVAFEIRINADPVHLAAAYNFFFADYWNVVFGLTGDRARIAPDAIIQIQRHAPGVSETLIFVRVIRIQRRVFAFFVRRMFTLACVQMFLQRLGAHDVAIFFRVVVVLHVEMDLGRCNHILIRALFNLHTRSRPRCICRSDFVSIEPMTGARPPADAASVTKLNCDHSIGLTRRNPRWNGRRDRSSAMTDPERVNVNVASLLTNLFDDAELAGSVRADQRCVVPRDFRQRLRQLLQPAIVREAAVEDARIGSEDDLKALTLRIRDSVYLLG